ncbi:hypothetical protein RUMTOR_01011 [[Ruminococcus] torques ATCC 27756]|uniref:Uncharacterized protein n=1 Tax=[Ruminococcus] torques ATCC 27756 TaxID=411460 RepID=A5KLA7_9FIRM|nr:hypothetical protein RUMTOR_01011 [[Ruminococcus] torques ATCC 27756]
MGYRTRCDTLAFYYYIWLNVMFFEQEKRIYPLYWDQDKIKIEK